MKTMWKVTNETYISYPTDCPYANQNYVTYLVRNQFCCNTNLYIVIYICISINFKLIRYKIVAVLSILVIHYVIVDFFLMMICKYSFAYF